MYFYFDATCGVGTDGLHDRTGITSTTNPIPAATVVPFTTTVSLPSELAVAFIIYDDCDASNTGTIEAGVRDMLATIGTPSTSIAHIDIACGSIHVVVHFTEVVSVARLTTALKEEAAPISIDGRVVAVALALATAVPTTALVANIDAPCTASGFRGPVADVKMPTAYKIGMTLYAVESTSACNALCTLNMPSCVSFWYRASIDRCQLFARHDRDTYSAAEDNSVYFYFDVTCGVETVAPDMNNEALNNAKNAKTPGKGAPWTPPPLYTTPCSAEIGQYRGPVLARKMDNSFKIGKTLFKTPFKQACAQLCDISTQCKAFWHRADWDRCQLFAQHDQVLFAEAAAMSEYYWFDASCPARQLSIADFEANDSNELMGNSMGQKKMFYMSIGTAVALVGAAVIGFAAFRLLGKDDSMDHQFLELDWDASTEPSIISAREYGEGDRAKRFGRKTLTGDTWESELLDGCTTIYQDNDSSANGTSANGSEYNSMHNSALENAIRDAGITFASPRPSVLPNELETFAEYQLAGVHGPSTNPPSPLYSSEPLSNLRQRTPTRDTTHGASKSNSHLPSPAHLRENPDRDVHQRTPIKPPPPSYAQ